MGNNNYFANVDRSEYVRNNLLLICKELGLSYTIIGKKAGFSIQILSAFATKRRNLNDKSLDRLEPIVDAYLKALHNSEAILRGVNNEGCKQ